MHQRTPTNPSRRRAILKNLGLVLLLVGLENALIFSSASFSSAGTKGGALIPPIPGWIIGTVWTGLFAGLGIVRGVLAADQSQAARRASQSVLLLLLACAIYPFYTLGLKSDLIGLLGNIATLGLSLWVAVRVGAVLRLGTAAPLAVAGWLVFATAALLDQAHLPG